MSIQIVRGENRVLNVALTDSAGSPWVLNSPTAIAAKFRMENKQGSGTLSLTLAGGAVAIVSDAGGTLTVTMSAADTLKLQPGLKQTIEIWITNGSTVRISRISEAIDVYKTIEEVK